MATRKQTRKPPTRKVSAAHRTREGRAKKAAEREPVIPQESHDDEPPRVTGLDEGVSGPFTLPPEPFPDTGSPDCVVSQEWASGYEAGYNRACEDAAVSQKQAQDTSADIHLNQSINGQHYMAADMVAHILSFRTQEQIEVFIYDKTGEAFPGMPFTYRIERASEIIRQQIRNRDVETLVWLMETRPCPF